jgi:hypothetical protein
MGMVTNITLFTFLWAFIFYLFTGQGGVMFDMYNCLNPSAGVDALQAHSSSCSVQVSVTLPSIDIPVVGKLGGVQNVQGSFFMLIIAAFGFMIAGIGLSILTNRFPDPWTWFSLAGVFLLGFITFPISLLNQGGSKYFPPDFSMLIGGSFILLYLLAFFAGYKGQGGSP